jgi:hypothetical protein
MAWLQGKARARGARRRRRGQAGAATHACSDVHSQFTATTPTTKSPDFPPAALMTTS